MPTKQKTVTLPLVDGDIGQAAVAQRVVESAVKRFGPVDALVNNAGLVQARTGRVADTIGLAPASGIGAALTMDNAKDAEGHHHLEALYPPGWEIWPLPEMCASQVLVDDISCKWAILTIAALSRSSARFNQLRRTLRGVSQKTLTQALRRLERSGLISRTVLETSPISVEYAITPLGRTLAGPFSAIYRWTCAYHWDVEAARRRFDARTRKKPGA
jgi:DNA-binding HxlR family transcriptional regulator